MQGYDLFMIIILAAAVVWGAWKGLAWQVASLASVLLSYVAAMMFRQPVAHFLSQQVELVPPLDTGLAMLILFLGTSLIVWVGFNLVSESMQKLKLKEFDRQVGALLGLAKGILLCTVITLLAITIVSDQQRQQIYNSRSGYYISVFLNKIQPILPPEVQSRLQPYEENLEKNVPRPGEFSNQFLNRQEEPTGSSGRWSTEADERSVERSSYEESEPTSSQDVGSAKVQVVFQPDHGEPEVVERALSKATSVQQMLMQTGGINKYRRIEVEILRPRPDHQGYIRIPCDYDPATRRVDPVNDYALVPGDRLMVKEAR